MDYAKENRSANPRIQCVVCGKWKRQFNRKGERIMYAACKDGREVVNPATGTLADVCVEHYHLI